MLPDSLRSHVHKNMLTEKLHAWNQIEACQYGEVAILA